MEPKPLGTWRVALIDSCGNHPGALARAAFVAGGGTVARRAPETDPTGHGSRIAEVLACGAPDPMRGLSFELLLAQVFVDARPASAAAVAAAVDWAVEHGAGLVHLSLGLAADRAVLRAAVGRAIDAGCVIVAAAPARGPLVYPATYPGVIRGTGDVRCAPGELSCLRPWLFGACPRLAADSSVARMAATAGEGRVVGGASIGAARVTRAILDAAPAAAPAIVASLTARSAHLGRERRTAALRP